MATRSGGASLEKMLYERSGLLGLSGVSGDMRVQQENKDPLAIAAMESFIYVMTKYACAYGTVLGGLDAFVFTTGIGEHSLPRARAAMQQDGVARREAGQAGKRFGRTTYFRLGQRRVGLGHPDGRRTDDRAAHACACPPLEEAPHVGGAAKSRDVNA